MTKEKYVKTSISELYSLIETILLGSIKRDYLISRNLNFEQIRRDLIRTQKSRKIGFCPLR
jgi:hypothetical protein